MRRPLSLPGLLLVFSLLAAACGSDSSEIVPTGATAGAPTGQPAQMVAIAASVDLYAGAPQRVTFGLVLPEGSLVSFGQIGVDFIYLGTAEEPTQAPGPSASAVYVPTYGTPEGGATATVTSPDEARGIYQATGVVFDDAGFYTATVTAEVDGLGTQTAKTTIEVLQEPQLLAPGDPAPPTENLTLDSSGVPEAAIDSGFAIEGEIPDPELHRATIAAALEEDRPILALFATPVYCASQFCGPVTDMLRDLAARYQDRATFIHVEVWKDFQTQALNDAAIDWLQLPNGDLTEPWLFLIGADGVIVDRWSSMWSEDDVTAELDELVGSAN